MSLKRKNPDIKKLIRLFFINSGFLYIFLLIFSSLVELKTTISRYPYLGKGIKMHHAPRSPDNLESNAFRLAKNFKVYPLSTEPNMKTLYCNEGEGWTYLKNDKLGFRNSREINKYEKFAYLIGDSYAHGACVPEENTFSGNLNKVLKQKNIFVKNLGGSGHNPIHYDMTLKSFFPTKLPENLNPEFVILLIMENDFNLQDIKNTEEALKIIKPKSSYEINNNEFDLTSSAKSFFKSINDLKKEKNIHGLSFIKNFIENTLKLRPVISILISNSNKELDNEENDSSYVIRTIESYSRRLNQLDIPLIVGFIPNGHARFIEKRLSSNREFQKFEDYMMRNHQNKNLYYVNFAENSQRSDYALYGKGHYSKAGYFKYSNDLLKGLKNYIFTEDFDKI